MEGRRQFSVLSGEVGIGKTTVVDLFVASLPTPPEVGVGRGQCVDTYGEGEPYLPMLEALGQVGQSPHREALRSVLQRYAPTWLVHLPGLLGDGERERLQRQLQGVTPARMLRELAEALEVLTTSIPLVLVLEDLHWSDVSTVNLLTYLAQRREARPVPAPGDVSSGGRGGAGAPAARGAPGAARAWGLRRTGAGAAPPRRCRGVYGGAAGRGGDGRAGGAAVSPYGGQRPVYGEHAGAPGGARGGETGGRPVDAPGPPDRGAQRAGRPAAPDHQTARDARPGRAARPGSGQCGGRRVCHGGGGGGAGCPRGRRRRHL